jgi:hypothetical protein
VRHLPGPLLDLLNDVRLIAKLVAAAARHRVRVPADTQKTVQGFRRLGAGFVRSQDGERRFGCVEAAVWLQREALQEEGRGDANVDASFSTVELYSVLLDISRNRCLEVVAVEALEQVGLNSIA